MENLEREYHILDMRLFGYDCICHLQELTEFRFFFYTDLMTWNTNKENGRITYVCHFLNHRGEIDAHYQY